MRGLCFLLALTVVPSPLAQTAPADSAPPRGLVDLGIIEADEAHTLPALADELVLSLGHLWSDRQFDLATPDSTLFADGLGDVWWSAPSFPVDGFRVFVQNGRVESVTLDFSSEGPDLPGLSRQLYDRLGSPRADGFYAVDQTGYPFSLAIDALANSLTARVVPGQVVNR
ncbi:MAG: hypothetical protein AAF170_08585 [Bacteroidota bacterium]